MVSLRPRTSVASSMLLLDSSLLDLNSSHAHDGIGSSSSSSSATSASTFTLGLVAAFYFSLFFLASVSSLSIPLDLTASFVPPPVFEALVSFLARLPKQQVAKDRPPRLSFNIDESVNDLELRRDK
ncbi:hypothetical protein LWI29_038055 [Acer saccharum]|uniref:Uncharacterized protein n=1 Tax=Acer saccharum TaxID=4024 RepID=A0AA39S6E4_ACESA|nr:hypothetical protein LWI29_038055 [Acer saccharum]